MQSSQSLTQLSPSQNSTEKKSEIPDQKKIFVKPTKQIHPLEFAGQDVFIPISVPNEFNLNGIPNELFLGGYISLLQSIQNSLGLVNKKIGKIYIIPMVSFARSDYFLKFPEDNHKLMPEIAKKYKTDLIALSTKEQPEKLIAEFLEKVLESAAIEKEKIYIEKYKKYLNKLTKKPGYFLDCEVIGASALEKKDSYKKSTMIIQQKFQNSSDDLRQNLYSAAENFVTKKGTTRRKKKSGNEFPMAQSELQKTISQFKKYFPFLQIDHVKLFIEKSVRFVFLESPTFLMFTGNMLYGNSMLEEIFQSLLAMNTNLHFIQIRSDILKTSTPAGYSEPYIVQNNEFILLDFASIFPNESKESTPSSSSQVLSLLNKHRIPTKNTEPELIEFIPGPDVKKLLYPYSPHFEGKNPTKFQYFFASNENPISYIQNILLKNYYYLNLLPDSYIKDALMMQHVDLESYIEPTKTQSSELSLRM